MSVAQQVRYKEEYIEAFERRKAVLVDTVRSDTQDRGGQLVFLVAGSGNRAAVTRGSNGEIPPADDSQTQVTLTFTEAHDLKEYTNFDIFRSQGDQIRLIRENSMAVIHRQQDSVILTALATGSVSLGAIGTMNKTIANKIAVILRNANVGEVDSGNIYCALSPAAYAYMTDITSFANTQYTATQKVDEGIPSLGVWKYWMGINWAEHTGLTGNGTTSTCLAWHKNAAGYAMSTRGIDAMIGYDQKQDTSWGRASIFHAAVKLQNSGIVKFTHDDTGLSS
jgi:hypothetical protein